MTDIPAEDWTGEVGDRWLRHIDRFESMLTPIGDALIATAGFRPGERVADVGCGGGLTTLAIARAIGPHGFATGIDIAPRLIALANHRRQEMGVPNCSFQCGDAQISASYSSTPFDRIFSRFGVMFFTDSKAAFANMRAWLKPGGEMLFACWGPPAENAWIALVGATIGQFAPMPERDPDGPGPFRFADPEATGTMLRAAGFSAVSFAPHQADQPFGGAGASPTLAAEFAIEALGVGEALADAGEGVRDQAKAALIEVFTPYHREGGVMLPGMSWFVRARSPE